jgi:hypothetical protein
MGIRGKQITEKCVGPQNGKSGFVPHQTKRPATALHYDYLFMARVVFKNVGFLFNCWIINNV